MPDTTPIPDQPSDPAGYPPGDAPPHKQRFSTRRKSRNRKPYHRPRKTASMLTGRRQVNTKLSPALHCLAYMASKRYRNTHPTIQDRIRWLLTMDAKLVLGLPLNGPIPASDPVEVG